MSVYSKYNLVYRLQKWMDTVAGQTLLNYAYSWGASIVILGALFKLTHLPGANFMLFIGMGTEVCVFFISAFDRPFDKTAEGRVMPTRLTEEYLETGKVTYPNGEQIQTDANGDEVSGEQQAQPAASATHISSPVQTVIIGGGSSSENQEEQSASANTEKQASAAQTSAAETSASPQIPTGAVQKPVSQPTFVPQMSAEEAEKLNEAQGNYVEELNTLVETLKKVNEQSTRLTRDSEEMENLNRTLTGISKIYEMQLKGASVQVGTIDQINERTRKMAEQIEQLNRIYARMIEAMTVNMHVAAPQQPQQPQQPQV